MISKVFIFLALISNVFAQDPPVSISDQKKAEQAEEGWHMIYKQQVGKKFVANPRKMQKIYDEISLCLKDKSTAKKCLDPLFTESLSAWKKKRYVEYLIDHSNLKVTKNCKRKDAICFVTSKNMTQRSGFILFGKDYKIRKVKI